MASNVVVHVVSSGRKHRHSKQESWTRVVMLLQVNFQQLLTLLAREKGCGAVTSGSVGVLPLCLISIGISGHW